ncbi:MAG: chemotaxis protein CheX [Deltaproteobacteria bacterium]|jgi:chemotaxis protein CheX|nr:chemotaxis protein CheX [Deltaproteobacteria bacterium]
MDVRLINPFLTAAMHVLKTMAGVEVSPGRPFLKKDSQATGDVSAIIGITGVASGSMALVFTEECILAIVSKLLGEAFTELNHQVRDAVGELTNMICGDGRRRLAEEGFSLQAGIPTIVAGKNHYIMHIADGPRLAVPFQTEHGDFMIEVAFSNK